MIASLASSTRLKETWFNREFIIGSSVIYCELVMVARPSRPNIVLVASLGALAIFGAATFLEPLSVGSKYADLFIGVVVLFASVLLYGSYRIDVSRSRRVRGFREWSGLLTSHRLMQLLLAISLLMGVQHIYDACLRIFVKVFE